MRSCPRCGGELKQGAGWERSAYERAGSALEVDEFDCLGCGARYRHRYEERFSGDIESWSRWSTAEDGWVLVDEAEWPTHRSPATPARAAPPARAQPPTAQPPGALSVVLLPHFNNQAALEYDRETGLHVERDKRTLADDERYWRGFYELHPPRFIGVYATPAGPAIFVDLERRLARRGVTRATIAAEGRQRRFRLEHDGEPLIDLRYTPGPSGFDCWSQDEAVVDFYVWLTENLDDPKWYDYYTVAAAEDVSWREPPPEPEPGPRFGEYALVWDQQARSFPERFRVLGDAELPIDFPDRQDWTGSVTAAQLEALLQRLRARFRAPRYLVLTIYGDDWSDAARKFRAIFDAEG